MPTRKGIESDTLKNVVVGTAFGAMAGGILEVAAGAGASEMLPHLLLQCADPGTVVAEIHAVVHQLCDGTAEAPVLAFMVGGTIGAVQGALAGAVYDVFSRIKAGVNLARGKV